MRRLTSLFARTASILSRAATEAIAMPLGVISPMRAVQYRHSRIMLSQYTSRAYAAARRRGPNRLWNPLNKTADAELRMDASNTIARARDLVRNNPYVAGVFRAFARNVVGQGIFPQSTEPAAEELWKRWADKADIYEKQRLVIKHLFQDGEILGVFHSRDYGPGIPQLGIQLLECDQLDKSLDGQIRSGNLIRRGVEVNRFGEPVAYHILDYHPGDNIYLRHNMTAIRVPAEDVIHVFDPDRVTQTRGIPLITPIILSNYDLGEYQDIEMIGAKLAAAFAVFIRTNYPDTIDPLLQTPKGKDAVRRDYIEPGRIERLGPGEEIQTASHNRPGETYSPFVRSNLQGEATGIGVSYETMSGDYVGSTYSSARAASLAERRTYRACQNLINVRFNLRIWRRFIQAAVWSGLLTAPRYELDPDAFASVRFVAPGWEWVDPQKDAKAGELELGIGTTTRAKICAGRGEDWEDNLYQLARENELAQILGLDIKPGKDKANSMKAETEKDAPDDGTGNGNIKTDE